MQNKPNLGRPGWGPQGDSAEQSQFRQSAEGVRGEMRQTKPNLGELRHLGDGRSSRPIVRNKPNSPIADSGQPCGDTPLRAAGPEAGCTNKPNSCRDAEPAIGVPGRANVRNEASWHRGHVRGKSFMGKELWCIVHAQDFGKTKPIPGEAEWDEPPGHGTRGERAKQTQFPADGTGS
jgi:hypothetical protein